MSSDSSARAQEAGSRILASPYYKDGGGNALASPTPGKRQSRLPRRPGSSVAALQSPGGGAGSARRPPLTPRTPRTPRAGPTIEQLADKFSSMQSTNSERHRALLSRSSPTAAAAAAAAAAASTPTPLRRRVLASDTPMSAVSDSDASIDFFDQRKQPRAAAAAAAAPAPAEGSASAAPESAPAQQREGERATMQAPAAMALHRRNQSAPASMTATAAPTVDTRQRAAPDDDDGLRGGSSATSSSNVDSSTPTSHTLTASDASLVDAVAQQAAALVDSMPRSVSSSQSISMPAEGDRVSTVIVAGRNAAAAAANTTRLGDTGSVLAISDLTEDSAATPATAAGAGVGAGAGATGSLADTDATPDLASSRWQQRYRQLKTEHDTTVNHHVELSKSFASMIEVLDKLRADHEGLQAAQQVVMRERGQARERCVQLKARGQRLEDKVKKLEKANEELRQEASSAKKRYGSGRSRRTVDRAKYQQLHDNYAKLEAVHAAAEEARLAAEADSSKLQEAVMALTEKLQLLTAAHTGVTEELTNLKSAHADLTASHDDVTARHAALARQHTEVQRALATKETEASASAEAVKRLNLRVVDLESQRQEATEALEVTQRERDELAKGQQQLSAENEGLQILHQALCEEHAATERDAQSAAAEVAALQARLTQEAEGTSRLAAVVQVTEERLAERDEELQQLRATHDVLVRDYNSASSSLQATTQARDEAVAAKVELDAELESLAKRVRHMQSEYSNLGNDFDALQAEHDALRQEYAEAGPAVVAAVQQERDAATAAGDAARAEVERLTSQLKASRNRTAGLEANLRQVEEAVVAEVGSDSDAKGKAVEGDEGTSPTPDETTAQVLQHVQQLRSKLRESEFERAQTARTVKALRTDVEDARVARDNALTRVKELEEQVAHLTESARHLELTGSALKTACRDAEKESAKMAATARDQEAAFIKHLTSMQTALEAAESAASRREIKLKTRIRELRQRLGNAEGDVAGTAGAGSGSDGGERLRAATGPVAKTPRRAASSVALRGHRTMGGGGKRTPRDVKQRQKKGRDRNGSSSKKRKGAGASKRNGAKAPHADKRNGTKVPHADKRNGTKAPDVGSGGSDPAGSSPAPDTDEAYLRFWRQNQAQVRRLRAGMLGHAKQLADGGGSPGRMAAAQLVGGKLQPPDDDEGSVAEPLSPSALEASLAGPIEA